ncbi:MAG: hypothetical protein GY759_10230 [Chloroflexi bacterium]|nr:hypothetical protein [Chloroflexota bacterium]
MYLCIAKKNAYRWLGLSAMFVLISLVIVSGSVEGAIAPHKSESAGNPVIRLETDPASAKIGETVITQVYADNLSSPGLSGWQVSIQFNPSILEIDDISYGTDLFSTGRQDVVVLPIRADLVGQVLFGQLAAPVSAGNPGPDGATGSSLHLATIQWRGISEGESDLNLSGEIAKLRDINNQALAPVDLINSHVGIEALSACDMYNFNADDSINIIDVGMVAARWMDDDLYDVMFDVAPQNAPDGVINITDIAVVASRVVTSCAL